MLPSYHPSQHKEAQRLATVERHAAKERDAAAAAAAHGGDGGGSGGEGGGGEGGEGAAGQAGVRSVRGRGGPATKRRLAKLPFNRAAHKACYLPAYCLPNLLTYLLTYSLTYRAQAPTPTLTLTLTLTRPPTARRGCRAVEPPSSAASARAPSRRAAILLTRYHPTVA